MSKPESVGVGIASIKQYDRALIEESLNEIDRDKLYHVSLEAGPKSSTIVAVSHVRRERNPGIHNLLAAAGIDVPLRGPNLQFSLHLYNSPDEVGRALAVLNSA